MSCPKSAKKRKLQNSNCERPASKRMAWDSYTSIKDFGYEFKEGRLVDIESGNGFNFEVTDVHWYNQQHYEKLGEVITEYVYELLQSDEVGLKKLEIPLDKEPGMFLFGNKKKNKDKCAKGFIFVSEDFHEKERLLVLVNGSGAVKAGQWARRLIINDCLDHGTQIPYIKKGIKDGYGVVVLNTNQNEVWVEVKGKKTLKTIKESETAEKHFSYVWKNIIEKAKASKIFVVAHSYGGYLVVDYCKRFSMVLERVVAVAFTDSVHSLSYHLHADVRKWFLKNSVNWVSSREDLDTPMVHQDHGDYITRVSAGTTRHEETSWKAMDSVFKYFQSNELESNNKNEIKKSSKCGGANLNMDSNNDEIVKKMNSEKEKSKDVVSTSTWGFGESPEENGKTEGIKSEGKPPIFDASKKQNENTSEEQPSEEDSKLDEDKSSEQNEKNKDTKSERENSSTPAEETSTDQPRKVTVISKNTGDIATTTANVDKPAKLAENKCSEENEKNEGTTNEGEPSGISENACKKHPQKVTVISKNTGDIATTTANVDKPAKLEENKSSEGNEKNEGTTNERQPAGISEGTGEEHPQKFTVIDTTTVDTGESVMLDESRETACDEESTSELKLPAEKKGNANEMKALSNFIFDASKKQKENTSEEQDKNRNDNEAKCEPTKPAEQAGAKEQTHELQLPSEKKGNEMKALSNFSFHASKKQNENTSEEQPSEENSEINKQKQKSKDSPETKKVSKESRNSKENDGKSSSEPQGEDITKVKKINEKPDEITSLDHSRKEDKIDAKPNEVKTTNDTGDSDKGEPSNETSSEENKQPTENGKDNKEVH